MLSPAEFAELLATIQTLRDDGARSEVRRAVRVEHPCRISIAPAGDSPDNDKLVQLKDISARGLCFLVNESMTAGVKFIAKLQPSMGNPISVTAHVVHCRKLDEHTFQIGAEFEGAPQPKETDFRSTAEDWMETRSTRFAFQPQPVAAKATPRR